MQFYASRVGLSAFLGILLFFGIYCCWQAPSIALAATPNFEEILIEDNLDDGYWVEAFDVNNDSKPDLVTSGLAVGEVAWYENPGDLTPSSQWTKHHIMTLPKPVPVIHQDIDEDGWIDLAIAHDYGGCMFNCGPSDGKISWLKNPGASGDSWTQYHIGDLVASHRLSFGKFTPSEKLELMVLPIVGAENWEAPVPVVLYTKPDDLYGATSWPSEVIDDSYYHVIHGISLNKFDANTNSNLDSLLVASQEGLTWLYYGQDNEWHIDLLATGDLSQTVDPETADNIHKFVGSGNVDIGKIGTDAYAYIPTVEPFHGNQVAVYTKNVEADLVKMRWKRTELDVFGYPNKNGEGAGHHLKTVDFDGDGNDEFIVAQRGPAPFQGVFYYKLLDSEAGLRPTMTFERTQISSSSAARIAIEDFDGDGRLDFATTGYYTPGYFYADNPQVLVFLNRIEQE
jgi:hypothetical protein